MTIPYPRRVGRPTLADQMSELARRLDALEGLQEISRRHGVDTAAAQAELQTMIDGPYRDPEPGMGATIIHRWHMLTQARKRAPATVLAYDAHARVVTVRADTLEWGAAADGTQTGWPVPDLLGAVSAYRHYGASQWWDEVEPSPAAAAGRKGGAGAGWRRKPHGRTLALGERQSSEVEEAVAERRRW
jgi:hypothetical protein